MVIRPGDFCHEYSAMCLQFVLKILYLPFTYFRTWPQHYAIPSHRYTVCEKASAIENKLDPKPLVPDHERGEKGIGLGGHGHMLITKVFRAIFMHMNHHNSYYFLSGNIKLMNSY